MKSVLITGSIIKGGLALSLAKAFEDSGWVVYHFDDQPSQKKYLFPILDKLLYRLLWKLKAKIVQKNLISQVKKIKPNVLLVLKGFYFNADTLKRVRREQSGIKMVHFNPDNTFNTWHFGNSNAWIRKTIPDYDIHLTWGKFLVPIFFKAGARKVHYFPFGFDPGLHQSDIVISQQDRSKYSCDLSFVGSWDEEREYWLSHLLDYNIKIWGNGWDRSSTAIQVKWQKSEAIGANFSKVCRLSKINLNLIRKQNVPAHNMRTFEIPASGGFMLSTRTEEQSQLFLEGYEIACFSTPQELRGQLEFYIKNDMTRLAMISRAQERAKYTYSYSCRVLQIESLLI